MTRESNTSTQPSGIPVTWPDLIEQNREAVTLGLDQLRTIVDESQSAADDPFVKYPAAESLLGASNVLAQTAIVYGVDESVDALHAILPVLPTAYEEIGDTLSSDTRVLAASVLGVMNVAVCCGVPLPKEVRTHSKTIESQWTNELASFVTTMADRERWTTAFSALAANEFDAVATVIGGGTIEEAIVPGIQFDFDTQGFVRYLAAAVRAEAPMTAILPALENFIQRFPHKLAAGSLRWDDLLYAGRIVFSNIGKEALDAVAPALAAMISEISLREHA